MIDFRLCAGAGREREPVRGCVAGAGGGRRCSEPG